MNRNLARRIFGLEDRKTRKATQHVVFAHSSVEADQKISALKRSGVAIDDDEFVSFITIYEPIPQAMAAGKQ